MRRTWTCIGRGRQHGHVDERRDDPEAVLHRILRRIRRDGETKDKDIERAVPGVDLQEEGAGGSNTILAKPERKGGRVDTKNSTNANRAFPIAWRTMEENGRMRECTKDTRIVPKQRKLKRADPIHQRNLMGVLWVTQRKTRRQR